jgi:hypothetical protein
VGGDVPISPILTSFEDSNLLLPQLFHCGAFLSILHLRTQIITTGGIAATALIFDCVQSALLDLGTGTKIPLMIVLMIILVNAGFRSR